MEQLNFDKLRAGKKYNPVLGCRSFPKKTRYARQKSAIGFFGDDDRVSGFSLNIKTGAFLLKKECVPINRRTFRWVINLHFETARLKKLFRPFNCYIEPCPK